jgi:selenocysteine lyase/cysteine desulfurase
MQVLQKVLQDFTLINYIQERRQWQDRRLVALAKLKHVMNAIKHPLDRKAVRFSFSHNNTIEELDYVMDVLKSF